MGGSNDFDDFDIDDEFLHAAMDDVEKGTAKPYDTHAGQKVAKGSMLGAAVKREVRSEPIRPNKRPLPNRESQPKKSAASVFDTLNDSDDDDDDSAPLADAYRAKAAAVLQQAMAAKVEPPRKKSKVPASENGREEVSIELSDDEPAPAGSSIDQVLNMRPPNRKSSSIDQLFRKTKREGKTQGSSISKLMSMGTESSADSDPSPSDDDSSTPTLLQKTKPSSTLRKGAGQTTKLKRDQPSKSKAQTSLKMQPVSLGPLKSNKTKQKTIADSFGLNNAPSLDTLLFKAQSDLAEDAAIAEKVAKAWHNEFGECTADLLEGLEEAIAAQSGSEDDRDDCDQQESIDLDAEDSDDGKVVPQKSVDVDTISGDDDLLYDSDQ